MTSTSKPKPWGREGMSARKIAIRVGTLGAENGHAPIRIIGVGDQIDQHFERTGETILVRWV